MKPVLPLAVAAVFWLSPRLAAEAPAPPEPPPLATEAPRPGPAEPVPAAALETSIRRGVDFLLERQNADGSFGSPRNTKGLNIYAPVPGAHQAFRAAVTALCVSALIESGDPRPEAASALERAETWLLEHLPAVRRATSDTIYNNWAHAYAIQALVRMHGRTGDAERRATIEAALYQQLDMLARYECVDGGWNYYDFRFGTQQPGGPTVSFVTATVLVAFKEAEEIGIEIPERLVRRGVDSIIRQRNPDFGYQYSANFRTHPASLINRPAGSLGRSQVCNLALRLWGDEAISDEILSAWLDRLFARNLWLDIGRKRPIPHETWFQIAGYFFYYGHYYAALCMEQLPEDQRPFYQDHMARILLRLQERDGSWWDFPFYDYHQQYGTALAIQSLVRCRR